jgi:MoxR-like ATPase
MLWGTRGVGKSSIVRQVAEHFSAPLVDLRLTTIEPVDIRGAIYADDQEKQTVWFPPEFLPSQQEPEGILFLDELTAADQRLQISAYSLILDRRVGNYRLPDGWLVVAAGNAAYHGAVSHDMGTALADRMFHFNVQTVVDAFLDYALANDFAPEVMAYLKVRPDKLDDTHSQLANDHLVGASPRGWEDVSNVLKSDLSEAGKRLFVQGRIGAANAAELFGVLREIQAGTDVLRLLDAEPGEATAALLPTSLDGLYGLIYGLLAAATDDTRMRRALAIIDQLPDIAAPEPLPIREAQTLSMELLFQKALERGLEGAVLASPVYARYVEQREQAA